MGAKIGDKGIIASVILLTVLLSISGCSSQDGSSEATTESSSPSLEESIAIAEAEICQAIRDLRSGWFDGQDIEDFTEHIPELIAVIPQEQEGEPLLFDMARSIALDLSLIEAGMNEAPTTKEASDAFVEAIDNFPVYTQVALDQCPED